MCIWLFTESVLYSRSCHTHLHTIIFLLDVPDWVACEIWHWKLTLKFTHKNSPGNLTSKFRLEIWPRNFTSKFDLKFDFEISVLSLNYKAWIPNSKFWPQNLTWQSTLGHLALFAKIQLEKKIIITQTTKLHTVTANFWLHQNF